MCQKNKPVSSRNKHNCTRVIAFEQGYCPLPRHLLFCTLQILGHKKPNGKYYSSIFCCFHFSLKLDHYRKVITEELMMCTTTIVLTFKWTLYHITLNISLNDQLQNYNSYNSTLDFIRHLGQNILYFHGFLKTCSYKN